jgi:hypothetical protein
MNHDLPTLGTRATFTIDGAGGTQLLRRRNYAARADIGVDP